jgi:SNF2 family DNA or RNA helicase
VEIKGHVKTIEKNLEYYRSGIIKVLFLNSNTSAAGINLQGTTDIILYHQMSTNNENQIIGRANRIGRDIDLDVHHLQ